MKIRNGFVSNSSSSSFIIGVPINEEWGNYDYLLKQFVKLFCNDNNITVDKYSMRDVATIIYGMMEGCSYEYRISSIGHPKLLENLMYLDEHDNDPDFKRLTNKIDDMEYNSVEYDKIDGERDILRIKLAISIMENMPQSHKYYILTTRDQSPFRNWMCRNIHHHKEMFKNVYFRWLG